MPAVILDADFLSSFLKIDRCDLIRSFFQIEKAVIPVAVHRELAQTELLTALLATSWIGVLPEEPAIEQELVRDPRFQALGAGDQACIGLARALPDTLLLMNDHVARRFAHSVHVQAISVPAFLLACRLADLVSAEQMALIVADLRAKDYYEFRAEVRDLLLS